MLNTKIQKLNFKINKFFASHNVYSVFIKLENIHRISLFKKNRVKIMKTIIIYT